MTKKRKTGRKTTKRKTSKAKGSRKTSSKRSSRTRKRSRISRRQAIQLRLPSIHLTPDQWLDIAGYALCTVAGLTILFFLPGNRATIPEWWIGLLKRGFGLGAYLLPLFALAGGLWIILREYRDRLPQMTPLQLAGVVLGYLALLATLHLVRLGGALGTALGEMLRTGLGDIGMVAALVTWWFVVAAFLFGVRLQDVVEMLQQLWARIAARRPRDLKPLPTRPGENVPGAPPRIWEEEPAPVTAVAPVAPAPAASFLASDDQAWEIPTLDEILEPGGAQDFSADILRQQARIIEETLESLGAPVQVKEINRGPVVTQFGLEPLVITNSNGKETKVKVSRISGLANDLALALEAKTIRVEAPIPGKGLVGVEVPNPELALVALRDIMESYTFKETDSSLLLCLGQDVSGEPVVVDLASMPHLLIAGTTGSGKSVCINAIIAALLFQNAPADLKLLMVDPKRVELTGYNGIPHLLSKVVVEMERVTGALQWVLREMDNRYRRFSEVQATHIRDYNERVAPRLEKKPLPYIVVIIDELADLMMMAPQETERSLCRIAQMARATGIHLVIATQRPSVDVVTGLIKANFPARIAFNVASSVDSRVILDMPGAEQLLGQGDMLFLPPDAPTPLRLQGAFVSDEELRRLVQYWKTQSRPDATGEKKPIQKPLWEEMEREAQIEYEDELLPDVIAVVLAENRASISLLQRKLRIGYTRAARIMDILEDHGVVGPQPSGGRAREVFPHAATTLLHP